MSHPPESLKSKGLIMAPRLCRGALSTLVPRPLADRNSSRGYKSATFGLTAPVIWSRSDRPARLLVEYDFNQSFSNPIRVRGPFALETTDYTARVDLTGLPEDREIFVQVMFEDLSNVRNFERARRRSLPHRTTKKSSDSFLMER